MLPSCSGMKNTAKFIVTYYPKGTTDDDQMKDPPVAFVVAGI